MKNSVKSVLLADVTALRFVLGICALLFSFGLMFGDARGGAYNDMLQYMPAWGWAIAFFGYGCIKFLIATETSTPSRFLMWCIVMFGCFLWLFTFHSFMENPMRPMGSADFMLMFLIISEMWVGASTLSEPIDD
jgi:hypothetical protein